MFTGSVATGRRVAARCGERLVPCVLELGGKSPFVVLAGADVERAAEAAAWSSFIHSGQVCVRTERILVDVSVADRFEPLLAARVAALRQAAPDPSGAAAQDLGSVTFARADRGRGAARSRTPSRRGRASSREARVRPIGPASSSSRPSSRA